MNFLSKFQPQLLSVLRITSAYMFMQHGTAKLFGIPYVERFENLQLTSMVGIAGLLEVFGGLLLLLGLFTRQVAFVLSGLGAAAYFIGHAPKGTPLVPFMNGGEPAALFCFIFLFIAAAGPGAWGLDNKFGKK